MKSISRWLVGMVVALGSASCQTTQDSVTAGDSITAGLNSPPSLEVQQPGEIKYYPSDEPLKLGMEHFHRGNFGIAERYFRDAVEKAPKDATAWIALAASYDRIRRFELSDQAYGVAIKLSGETAPLLNNQGYSYMLRGDLVRARAKFVKAQKMDPDNPTIVNNLALLNSSRKFIQRAPEP